LYKVVGNFINFLCRRLNSVQPLLRANKTLKHTFRQDRQIILTAGKNKQAVAQLAADNKQQAAGQPRLKPEAKQIAVRWEKRRKLSFAT